MSVLVVLIAALIAAFTDVRWGKIPNTLIAAFLFAGLAMHAVEGPKSLVAAFAIGIIALALGLAVFATRLMAGGDVKFFVAAFVTLGVAEGVQFLLYTLVAGALLAIVVSASRGSLRAMLANVRASVVTLKPPVSSGRMPYAAAMLAGALVLLATHTVLPSLRLPI